MEITFTSVRQRVYASLLILGAGILLYRTIDMLSQGVLNVLVAWVSLLLFAELLIDVSCILTSVIWWIANDRSKEKLPLRFGAAAAILHALRVLVFLLGRTGPWFDFDVRPEQRAMHGERWTWGEVYFASVMSLLGVIGVVLIWQYRKRLRKV